ncbi:prepilin peptidase [Chloroflexota bacterium]
MIIVFILLGLFVGSFINVCIDRLPQGQSIIRPPSHCAACNRKLSIPDLVPLFSYIWLRGKCRYCNAHISLRLPVVEGITALMFALLYWNSGLGLELAIFLVYGSLLIIIFVIDLENQLVLDKIVFPGMVIAIAFSFFWPGIKPIYSFWPELGVESSLAGGFIGFVAMALPFFIYRRGMGFGDVKLAALVGVMTGYPLAIIAILMSWIIGGIVAAILLAFKLKGPKDPIPSATFLAVSAMVTLLWGEAIWQWYIF